MTYILLPHTLSPLHLIIPSLLYFPSLPPPLLTHLPSPTHPHPPTLTHPPSPTYPHPPTLYYILPSSFTLTYHSILPAIPSSYPLISSPYFTLLLISTLIYTSSSLPSQFPMSSREYVFLRRSWISADEDAIVLVNKSVEHSSVPEGRKYVRVRSYFSEMVIRPHSFSDEVCQSPPMSD